MNRTIPSLLVVAWGLWVGVSTTSAQTSLPPFGHVLLVMEENHSYSEIVGSSSMPYLNSLISQYGLATDYIADTHPSIDNYFMLTVGKFEANNADSWNCTTTTGVVSDDNIARELINASKTWKVYAESIPSTGYTGCDSGYYRKHHNPFAYLTDVANSSTQTNNMVDFTNNFANDLANGTLPQYSFIVPNVIDDGDDATLAQADAWLETNIDPLVKSAVFQKDGLLIIVFDEAENITAPGCTMTQIESGTWCGGQVAAVIVSPFLVSVGYQSLNSYHHENVLRLMAQGLGLATFPGISSTAANMSDFFVKPNLAGFSPSSGAVSTPVTLTGTGLNGVTSVYFGYGRGFNGTPAPFTVVSSTQISTSVPPGAITGRIKVTTPVAPAVSAASFTVDSTAAPTLSSFAPASGVVGITVTVTGANFTGTTSVSFNGTPAKYFVGLSDTQIRVIVPVGATSGLIEVTNTLGVATSAASFIVKPRITGFSPTSGAMGTVVTITGYNFTGVTSVTFGPTASFSGTPASFTVISDTQISTGVSGGATSGRIKVTAPQGYAISSTGFSVNSAAAPNLSTFSPTSGYIGTPVTLTGTNFTGTTGVGFNGVAAIYFGLSDTQLKAIVPAASTSGPITVTNTLGSATSVASFIVNRTTVTGFSPVSGSLGAAVTITGSNFTGAASVRFNGTQAAFAVVSDTQISTTVPGGATTGNISVTAHRDTGTSPASFTVNSTAAPTINSFSPTSGVAGTTVTVTGTNFTGAKAVAFNGTTTTNFQGVSDTQLAVMVPPGATSGPITLTNSLGIAASSTPFTVNPRITFSPTNGSLGTPVTIIVDSPPSLPTYVAVNFNGTAATLSQASSTQISTTVPGGATTGPIGLTYSTTSNTEGIILSSASFTANSTAAPSINSFSPPRGVTGTTVTIAGTNLTGTKAVAFNGTTTTNFQGISDTQLAVVVPPGVTSGPITLTNSLGRVTSSAAFLVDPLVTGFSPTSGSAGTGVTIAGYNFTGATTVTFNGTAATFTVVSDTQISTTVPTGATTGPITVMAPQGSSTSSAGFTVSP